MNKSNADNLKNSSFLDNADQTEEEQNSENFDPPNHEDINVLDDMVADPDYFISPNEFYNSIKPLDGAIELVGKVHSINNITNISSQKDQKSYNIFKFQIESRDKSVYDIVIWDDEIDRWKYAVKLNSILHLEGLFARPQDPKYSSHAFGFALTVRSNTIINCLKQCKLVNEKPEIIELFTNLEKVIYTTNVVKLKGVVKSNFQSNTSSVQYIIGSVTDLKLKLNVKIFNCHDLKLLSGEMVVLKGMIVEEKGQLYFKVSSFQDVEKIADEKLKDIKSLSKIVKTPKRKMEMFDLIKEKKLKSDDISLSQA